MSLYTKYRPKDWNSVVSQDYITTILRNSLKSGRVSHAYLFHGSRGTGKTTSARILAKALNCTDIREGNPCHECECCRAFDNETMLDIIEIDGASNNGVENVRELIERARFEPSQGKYKIYIIDEVHMLSSGAFNALLKILEEPPPHVKFILATTEIDKVPETIRSRTLRFDFRKITLIDIISRLEHVCREEGIKTEEEAISIIAKAARGGLRDALTLLEQNIIDSEVSTEHVGHTLSLVEESLLDAAATALRDGDTIRVQEIIEKLRERHIQVRSFFDQMMYYLRDQMVAHIDDANFRIYDEILSIFEEAYGKIRVLPDGMMLIELTLLRIVKRGDTTISAEKADIPTPSSGTKGRIQKDEESYITLEKNTHKSLQRDPPVEDYKEEKEIEQDPPHSISQGGMEDERIPTPQHTSILAQNIFSYPALINTLKESHPALTIDLKTARFAIEGTILTLIFTKKWNYDRVNTPKVKNIISEACSGIYEGVWEVKCELKEGNTSTNISDGVF